MVLAVGKPCALAEGSSNSLCSFAVTSDGFVILQNNAPIKNVHIGISYLVVILIKPIADSFYLKCALSVIHLPPTFFLKKRNKNVTQQDGFYQVKSSVFGLTFTEVIYNP